MGTFSTRVRSICLKSLKIPFREQFRHTSGQRSQTATVIVRVSDQNGNWGYGEGCPRSYVTCETVDSALQFLSQIRSDWIGEVSLDRLKELHVRLKDSIDQNPAAFCALEMALLDLLGKSSQRSIETLLLNPLEQVPPNLSNCSIVIGLGSCEERVRKWKRAVRFGFRHFKFKIDGTEEDLQFFRHLKKPLIRWPNSVPFSFRLDGNGCFKSGSQAIEFFKLIKLPLDGIEEPLSTDLPVFESLQIARHLSIPVILDENFTRIEQIEAFKATPKEVILNARISKLGGILRTQKVFQEAARAGIRVSLGCQVGETSLLTRAQLVFKNSQNPLFFEGGFAPYLLERDPTSCSIGLQQGGRLRVPVAVNRRSGLGIDFEGFDTI